MQQPGRFRFRLPEWARRLNSIRASREEGQSLYELAWAAPILSVLLIGVIYGGITLYDYVELEEAVQVGARILATNSGAGTGPPTACQLEETALKNAAGNLKTSLITITETFNPSASLSCTSLTASSATPGSSSSSMGTTILETATVNATYPCALYFPRLKLNLCPVAQGTVKNSSGTAIGSCQSAYCISATMSVTIE